MLCGTIGFPTELLSDTGEELADLDQLVSLELQMAAYRPQYGSRLERKKAPKNWKFVSFLLVSQTEVSRR